jgi:pyruvate/2-oxoacid:ferredoxin oxidoreductase alpha subunit
LLRDAFAHLSIDWNDLASPSISYERILGDDLTIVTYGSTVNRAVQAANALEKEDAVTAGVLDLRSLSPYDWRAIEKSVQKRVAFGSSMKLAQLRLRRGDCCGDR